MARENNTNHYFLLHCLAALTAAAAIAVGVITAISLTAGTATLLATSTVAIAPIIPIALACIGLICLISYLCSGNRNGDGNNGYTTFHVGGGAYPYQRSTFISGIAPQNYYRENPGFSRTTNHPSSNIMGHPSSRTTNHPSSNTMGHPSNIYGHSGALNMHGHFAPQHTNSFGSSNASYTQVHRK